MRLICQARSSTIPGWRAPTKPVDYGLTAGQSADTASIEHTGPNVGDYRRSIPAASRIIMSVNTASVSIPCIAPVISSNTKPCIADQNSSAA